MKNKTVFKKLTELSAKVTSHNVGQKTIFLTHNESETNLMQAALGTMIAGEIVENHLHKTMEECYYFLKGSVIFYVNDEIFECESGCFIKVPSNTAHYMEVKENCEFIYWGIAI